MVDVVAVLNDTTGTLMAGSYLDKNCFIGLIMGKIIWQLYFDLLSEMIEFFLTECHIVLWVWWLYCIFISQHLCYGMMLRFDIFYKLK